MHACSVTYNMHVCFVVALHDIATLFPIIVAIAYSYVVHFTLELFVMINVSVVQYQVAKSFKATYGHCAYAALKETCSFTVK